MSYLLHKLFSCKITRFESGAKSFDTSLHAYILRENDSRSVTSEYDFENVARALPTYESNLLEISFFLFELRANPLTS